MTLYEAEKIYNIKIRELRDKEKEGVPTEVLFKATEQVHKELQRNITIALLEMGRNV